MSTEQETDARTNLWRSLRRLADALAELTKEATEALREERGRE